MNKLNNKQKIFLIFTGLIVIGVSLYYFYIVKNNNDELYEETEKNVLIPYDETNYTGNEEKVEETKNIILIDISGEVNKPGVVELEEGARIKDAIEMAGGITKNAYTSDINLAYKLEDGMKIKIPSKKEVKDSKNQVNENNYISTDAGENIKTSNSNSTSDSNTKMQKTIVNINTATQKELETLPGIGQATAEKIIKYREEKGKFNKIDDLKKVSGIGDAKFEKIKDYIKI